MELKLLGQRIAELGREGRGGIQAVRFDELREWAIQRRQHVEQIWQLLRHGQVPNHIALGVLRVELAHVFHRLPSQTAANADGHSAGPVCQRFGGSIEGATPVDENRQPRLNADVTAFSLGLEGKTGSHLARIVAAMMNDRSQAGNALGSWLASERAWLKLLPTELEQQFSLDAIRSTVEDACRDLIDKPDERRSWFTVGTVLGHLPPTPDERVAFEKVLANIDLVDYLTRDAALAVTAVNVIGAQAHHLSDAARQAIIEPLLRLAEALGGQPFEDEQKDDLAAAIVATFVELTWLQPDGAARSTALAMLLERLSAKSAS